MATFQIKSQKIKTTTAATKTTKSYHQKQQLQRQVTILSPTKKRRRRQQEKHFNPQAALCGNYTQQQQQQIGFQCPQHQQQQHHHHQHHHHHQQEEQPQQQLDCQLCSRSTSTIAAASTVALTRRRCPALGLTATFARLLPPPLGGSFSKFNFDPTDSLFMMITMLVVVTVVISGNAVFAAQRDSYKPKDLNSISNNANAIPNAISGTGNAASNGNTNNVSNGNTNSNSASSNSNTTTTSNSLTSSSGAATSTTTTTTTAVLTSSTHSTSSSSTISSSSLQKGSGSSVGINRNTIEIQEDTRNGPYFDKAASKNVTALLGKTAYLNCRVKNLGNKTMLLQVSWVRHRDIHLLTVGRYTYTSDQRFRAIHQPQTEDWILQIKYPQHRDSGIYECQVSTTPHMSHYIHLNVVEPSTEIIGAPDLYIESGSTINLTCVILNSPEPPAYIFWNHNNAIINYDSPRGGVSVVTNKGETTTSFLLIKSARPSDSGHYQCNPSNAKHKSVTVHVLNGEFPAAMQHAALSHHRMSPGHYLLVYLSIYCCSLAYVRRYMRLHAPAVN